MGMPATSHAGRAGRALHHPAGTVLMLTAATCALIAGCASGAPGAHSGASAAGAVGLPAAPNEAASGSLAGRSPAASRGHTLTGLQSPAIIYTATLTVRVHSVSAAATRAAQIAAAAGGYVANESTNLDPSHPALSTVQISLKIPASRYPATLSELATALGNRLSESQQAQDVSQAVADVASRVSSAQDAIAQLRKLLARAGSVASLLSVQDQINRQEANLEALLAQQRVLAHETSYATISVLLVSPAARAHAHARKAAGGFTSGLRAGWHALRAVVALLLTALGAVLPFLIPAAVIALIGYLAWRRQARRRAHTPAAQ
jgi:hypothetical protein